MRQILYIILWLFVQNNYAQEILISEEMSIRNDYYYEILGNIGDRMLLFRDQGENKILTGYDSSMETLGTRNLWFKTSKIKIYGIIPNADEFLIYYSYRKSGVEHIEVNAYAANGDTLWSKPITTIEESSTSKRFKFEHSKNMKSIALYRTISSSKVEILVINTVDNTLFSHTQFELQDFHDDKDFEDIYVRDNGIVIMTTLRSNIQADDKQHNLILYQFDRRNYIKQHIDLLGYWIGEIKVSINELQNRIGIVGLLNTKNNDKYDELFVINEPVDELFKDNFEIALYDISNNMLKTKYQKKEKKVSLQNYSFNDIIFRQDGGLLVSLEQNSEYYRSSPALYSPYGYNPYLAGRYYDYSNAYPYYNNNTNIGRSSSDHLNQDILLVCFNPDKSIHWSNVLYKKQFSQDDSGIYSSYFLFESPSRLRFIYNDEIKKENTISEYVMNGIGEYKRKTILNTQYKDLKMRIKDAFQLSNNQLIIPSEYHGDLRLVKLIYQ